MEEFRQMLRRLRVERGWSLRDLDARAGVNYSYIGRVERGDALCSLEWAGFLDQALEAGGKLVASYRATTGTTQPKEGDALRRRTVLRAMTGLAFAGSSADVALEALRHGLEQAVDTDAADWEETAAEYARDFYMTPPHVLAGRLGTDLTILQHLIEAHPTPDLFRVAGQLSVIMAMTLASTGQIPFARRWWRTARGYADRSADLDTRIWVRDWEVVNGTYERRPVQRILSLANEAEAVAGGRVCCGTAGLTSGRAQALAVAGDADGATAAVRATAELTERMAAPITADTESMFGWPEVRLRHTESFVYTHIGATDLAMIAQDRALELYGADPALSRERSQMQMHRASCLIQDGHIADGLRYAADALDELPGDQHNALLYQVAQQVLADVPPPERRRAEAVDLRERLKTVPAQGRLAWT